jgi:hypothetical protein
MSSSINRKFIKIFPNNLFIDLLVAVIWIIIIIKINLWSIRDFFISLITPVAAFAPIIFLSIDFFGLKTFWIHRNAFTFVNELKFVIHTLKSFVIPNLKK